MSSLCCVPRTRTQAPCVSSRAAVLGVSLGPKRLHLDENKFRTRLLGYEVAGLPPGLCLTPRAYSCCHSGLVLAQAMGTHQPPPVLTHVWGGFTLKAGSWDGARRMTETWWLTHLHPWASVCLSGLPYRTDGTFALLLALLSAFPLISAPTPMDLQDSLASQWRAWPCRPCLPWGRPAVLLTPGAAGTCVCQGRAAPSSFPSVQRPISIPLGLGLAVLVTCLSVIIHL